jgi:hypothetical protein
MRNGVGEKSTAKEVGDVVEPFHGQFLFPS